MKWFTRQIGPNFLFLMILAWVPLSWILVTWSNTWPTACMWLFGLMCIPVISHLKRKDIRMVVDDKYLTEAEELIYKMSDGQFPIVYRNDMGEMVKIVYSDGKIVNGPFYF